MQEKTLKILVVILTTAVILLGVYAMYDYGNDKYKAEKTNITKTSYDKGMIEGKIELINALVKTENIPVRYINCLELNWTKLYELNENNTESTDQLKQACKDDDLIISYINLDSACGR